MFMRLGLVGATGAVLALTWMACGEDAATGAACDTDEDCRTGELCHPDAKQCVQTCEIGADCPSSARNCEELSSTDTRNICKCVTSELCAGGDGTGSSAICSTAFEICMTKCGSDSDCPSGTTCETSTGQCLTCNPSSTTLGTNGGPDTCNYGDFCSSAGRCTAAPEGACTQATASGAPTWNRAAQRSPVITSVSATFRSSTDPVLECGGGGTAAEVTIRYYAPNGLTTHTNFEDLQTHVFFRVATDFVGAHFAVQNPPANSTFGEFTVGIACQSSSRTAALYIADEADNTSNVVCVSW
jgi:hypothetical protein